MSQMLRHHRGNAELRSHAEHIQSACGRVGRAPELSLMPVEQQSVRVCYATVA